MGDAHQERQCRRAQTILLYAAGLPASDIASVLGVHRNTTYADLHAFDQQGLDCVSHVPTRGAPVRITAAQIEAMQRIAHIPPYELGLPYGRWSLQKLCAYLRKQHVVKTISREY